MIKVFIASRVNNNNVARSDGGSLRKRHRDVHMMLVTHLASLINLRENKESIEHAQDVVGMDLLSPKMIFSK